MVTRRYAGLVFLLTFGLMLSDYMSRQVINAVFPILKIEWSLTDSQLGMLVSVVALLVGHAIAAIPLRTVITALFASRTARWNYVGSGLQMFVQGSLLAWLPSFFNRHHGMEVAEAALYAAFVLLTGAVGMMACGAIADRASVRTPRNRLRLPALYALLPTALALITLSSSCPLWAWSPRWPSCRPPATTTMIASRAMHEAPVLAVALA